MDKADPPVAPHDANQRHTAKFEKVDFLAIHFRNRMGGIRQANVGYLFIGPVTLKRRQVVGANRQDLCLAGCKGVILIAHARQLRAAVRSKKAAQECKQDYFFLAIIGKPYALAVGVGQFEIRGRLTWRD